MNKNYIIMSPNFVKLLKKTNSCKMVGSRVEEVIHCQPSVEYMIITMCKPYFYQIS
jgi:hypothetical protein